MFYKCSVSAVIDFVGNNPPSASDLAVFCDYIKQSLAIVYGIDPSTLNSQQCVFSQFSKKKRARQLATKHKVIVVVPPSIVSSLVPTPTPSIPSTSTTGANPTASPATSSQSTHTSVVAQFCAPLVLYLILALVPMLF